MANVYVSAAGSSTTPFDTWAKAGSLTSALGVAVAGDDIWVAATHSEVAASSITYTFAGTNASPNRCIAASTVSGNAPPISSDLVSSATPSVASSTGGSVVMAGTFYCRGLVFNAGSSTGAGSVSLSNASFNYQKYELCSLNLLGSGAGATIALGNGAASTVLINTTVSFGAVGHAINARGRNIWQNTVGAITGANIPTTLFSNNVEVNMVVEGVDLSAATGTIVANATLGNQSFWFKDCKLNASASVLPATGISGLGGSEAYVVRCDSGATNYRQEKHNYCADLVQNTSITRSGGTTDGTTPLSWQITTTANAKWYNNFQSFPISMWNTTVGSPITVVIHATSNIAAGGFPTNADIWIEVEYLGSASSPQGSFATNTISNVLTTATNYTSDGATWANAPAGGTFAMSVSITPQLAGPITVYVRCAKVSTIFYVDPLIASS